MSIPNARKSSTGSLDHVILKVKDIGAEVSFLELLLGIVPSKVSDRWAEFPLEGFTLALNSVAEVSPLMGCGDSVELSMRVDNLVACETRIVAQGVTFVSATREICSDGVTRYLYAQIRSPNGHLFSLYERVSQP